MDRSRPAASTLERAAAFGIAPEGERLIMVSNRGPVGHRIRADGSLEQRCHAGGVATALSSLAPGTPVTWIAAAISAGDRRVAAQEGDVALEDGKRVRFVVPPEDAYRLYYGTFCNPILWFLQHSIWRRLDRPDVGQEARHAWQEGYLPVNQAFAEAVIEELDAGGGNVMLHDYHLYAAPLFIRNRRPHARLQHFIHVPWPEPEEWERLPRPIAQSVCEGLLANDSVVFQTEAFARNFVHTCKAFLEDIEVDDGGELVRRGGHVTRVWWNPISVDIWELRGGLAAPEADRYRAKLAAPEGMRTIVRVDRLDPTKNAAAGFRAFGRLLELHPEWVGKVRFLAFLVPSRSDIPEYKTYAREVFSESERLNARYATKRWTPITVFHEHNRTQALVGMSQCDVLLVNSTEDGMNLVAKEGPAVATNDGALVLSRAAGAYHELRAGALPITPEDIDGTAEALHRALTMPAGERRERAQRLREAILRHDLRRWFRKLLEDLEDAGARAEERDEPRWPRAASRF